MAANQPNPLTLENILLQISQILANQQAPAAAVQINQGSAIPVLTDITPFEACEDKSRVTEWINRFKFALDCAAPAASDGIKVKCLMNKLSEAAFSEYARSILPAEVRDFDFATTTQKLEKLFAKPQSVFIDRYECLKAVRQEGEDFRLYINRHRKLLNNFKFEDLTKDQFYCLMLLTSLKSHSDTSLRQRILAKLSTDGDNITYDAVVEDLINYQSTIAEAKIIETSSSSRSVNAIRKNEKGKAPQKQEQRMPKTSAPIAKCWRCGGAGHWPNNCWHNMAKCQKCGFVGHLPKQCEAVQEWKRKNKSKKTERKNVGHIRIGMAKISSDNGLSLEMKMRINQKPAPMFPDTGSDITIIDEITHNKVGRPHIEKCFEVGKTFDGKEVTFIGKGICEFEFNGIKIQEEFYVAKNGSLNLLGRFTMEKFGLLDELKRKISGKSVNVCKSNNTKVIPSSAVQIDGTNSKIEILKASFPDVIKEELGHCTKEKAHLVLKNDAQPIYRKARPVPYNSMEIVERELDRMEKLGVIKKVDYTEWAAPILIVKKADGSARLCIDYSTGLNEALLYAQHPLPIPEDIFATLNGGKIFSQIDLRDAYLQIDLDEQSKALCGLATHKGNYRMERLPFGVKTAPAIFQSIMDKMLAGLKFATAYLDDIIVVSGTIEEHTQHLEEVFGRIQSYGFRVKLEKSSFFRDQIKYLGQIIDRNGRRPDSDKIHAIEQMPAPKDLSALRSFLGMVNHYQQYVKNMRFIRKPLDDMLKKETEWKWTEECEKAFRKLKEILVSDLLICHYDPKMVIIVAADASEHGIGAVISHKFPNGQIKAIAHASKSLTPAEKNYSQIEKEGLALIFSVQKFHKMIYGRHFILQTDHKPLLSIFGSKKGIRQCSANRLLRWSLTLLAYNFEIESLTLLAYNFEIEYVNTKDFGQADALSRLIAEGPEQENDRVIASLSIDKDIEKSFDQTIGNLPIKFKDLVEKSEKDETIQKVMKFVRTWWLDKHQMIKENEKIQLFSRRKDELSILKGCLMYGDRIVVPENVHCKILALLHKGHPGMKRMKQLARQHVFWPKLDQQIEDFVSNCEPCQMAAKAPVKTNLHSWPKSTRPWQRIHVDYAGPFFGKEFLIVVDAFSKYPEVFEMPSKSALATIERLRYLFTRHGLPEILVSDNGTQFTSNEFTKFATNNAILHLFSAPYNPMSNGQVERFVDTFKRAFRKLKGEGVPNKEVIDTFLITYRTTPNDSLPDSKTPAEMLLGRRPRTTLDLLKPPPSQPIERDQQMERQFNHRFGTRHQIFALNNKVFARHRPTQIWHP